MNDEELLNMYRKYKRKRVIIIFGITLIFAVLIGSYLYFHFNNTSSPNVEEKTTDKVIVKDEVAPIIKLKVDNVEILKGDDINYLDYIESVIDDIDGDLLDKLEYEKIDTSIVGEQSIIYRVSDNSKNNSQAILSVLIKEQEMPEENKQENNSPNVSQNSEKTKKPSSQNTQSNPTQNSSQKEQQPTQKEPPKVEEKPSEKIVKYFLFSDGYTMKNVAEVCATELRKTNKTGMCSPIQDENGIYLGMKLETN